MCSSDLGATYSNGVRDREAVAKADAAFLAGLPKIGPAMARSIKEQVGAAVGHIPEPERNAEKHADSKQSRLLDY
mgnify:CR=1 FL=1